MARGLLVFWHREPGLATACQTYAFPLAGVCLQVVLSQPVSF